MVSLAQLRDADLSGLAPAATAYDTRATNSPGPPRRPRP